MQTSLMRFPLSPLARLSPDATQQLSTAANPTKYPNDTQKDNTKLSS